MEPNARPASVVKCEKHGLHYDSAKANGCITCRREAGEIPAVRSGGAAKSSGSIGAALAVTAVLVGLSAFALQMAHAQLMDWLRSTGNPSVLPTTAASEYQQKQLDGALQEIKEQSQEPADAP